MFKIVPCYSTEKLDFDKIKNIVIEDFTRKLNSLLKTPSEETNTNLLERFNNSFTFEMDYDGELVENTISISEKDCDGVAIEDKSFTFPTIKVIIMKNKDSFMYGYCVNK